MANTGHMGSYIREKEDQVKDPRLQRHPRADHYPSPTRIRIERSRGVRDETRENAWKIMRAEPKKQQGPEIYMNSTRSPN